MQRHGRHREIHLAGRIGWLRAAVPGANDGGQSVKLFTNLCSRPRGMAVPYSHPRFD